jgi:uncharacterized protein YukE
MSKLEEHFQKSKDLEIANSHLQLTNSKLSGEKEELSNFVKEKNISYWENKLDQANQTIQKLLKECSELKGKQIDLEIIDERKRVEHFIGYRSVSDPRQSDAFKLLIQEYKKKYKSLEAEKKELERKYRHLKSHSTGASEESFLRKIEGLERLTEKQQAEMARLIETYDRELHSLATQNHRLKESCHSMAQELTKKSTDLTEKERELIQLKYTTDKISFEN